MYESNLNTRQSRMDWQMLVALGCLMVIGVLFIFSVTMSNDITTVLPWYRQPYFKQIVWYGIGVVSAGAVCLLDYQLIARWALVIYWFTIFWLLVVLIPKLGTTHGWGARRWIDFGPLQFQPSEFAKLAFIVLMAHFLSRPHEELRSPPIFAKALGMTLLPVLLILKEPDLGSALMFLPVGLVMMYVAGVPVRFLRRVVGVGFVVVALLLTDILFAPRQWQLKMQSSQRDRLLVYFGRDFAPPNASPAELKLARERERKASYNIEQALISVGSGGLTGKGWRQGTQNALGYLPRGGAHNDFIFSVIAEESGFVGSVVVIALYTVVIFTGIRIASQARDRLGRVLAAGMVTLLFSHIFVNIGVNIRILPVTGVPLPLLSYGGSSVLCSLIAAGFLQNIHIHRRSY